jgi:ATP-dependent protease HslVU (ClpYQ) peptidase subunit
MTILVAVKKNGRVFLGADRVTTFGNEYATDLINGSKIMKLKHAYLATSGYTLLDNVIEHMFQNNHKMMENSFADRAQVFSFFLDLYAELKKTYTLVATGKDTYASMHNVFLVVTPTSIYGIANNLSVHEYERFAAKGTGSDYSQGCLYGIYDLFDDGEEICRLALEAACHFSIYCKEPLDILEVMASDFSKASKGYKAHKSSMKTHAMRKGTGDLIAVQRKLTKSPEKKVTLKAKQKSVKSASNGKFRGITRKAAKKSK